MLECEANDKPFMQDQERFSSCVPLLSSQSFILISSFLPCLLDVVPSDP